MKIYVKEKDKRILNNDSKYSWDTHILAPTGLLYLRVGERSGAKEFIDGKLTIEQQMSRIIAWLELEADKEITAEAQRLAWRQEYEKQRQAELAIEQAKQQEEEKFNLLLSNAAKFQQACMMRNYINAVKQNAMDQNQLSDASIAWIEWATKKANDCDPTMRPS